MARLVVARILNMVVTVMALGITKGRLHLNLHSNLITCKTGEP